ncbi:MAG: hypothetical protein ABIE75_03925 [Candidatus Omnitrophota bacterium]
MKAAPLRREQLADRITKFKKLDTSPIIEFHLFGNLYPAIYGGAFSEIEHIYLKE